MQAIQICHLSSDSESVCEFGPRQAGSPNSSGEGIPRKAMRHIVQVSSSDGFVGSIEVLMGPWEGRDDPSGLHGNAF